MPPKAKITKEMILRTALELTREAGFSAVNARSIAKQLECSTRPLFTCYANMEELKREFLAFAYAYYEEYTLRYGKSRQVEPCLILPLSYIQFAREEPRLFQLLFIDDMDLQMTRTADFYKEVGNEEKARAFSESIGIDIETGKTIFFDLFLYSHGIAVLSATQKIALDEAVVTQKVADTLSAFIHGKKEGGII